MKLIAEIDAVEEGRTMTLSCNGDVLTVNGCEVMLAKFRQALVAVAGPSLPVTAPAVARHGGGTIGEPPVPNPVSSFTLPPTRNPDGTRNGLSPRYGMRAAKPEADVETAEDNAA